VKKIPSETGLNEDGQPAGEFSVVQYLHNDLYEYVRRYVTAEEAVRAAEHFTSNVMARIGMTRRVIITDGGDCVCFEWLSGEGVVFPPKEEKADAEDKS
jgi:hypothetical protein